MYDNLLLSEKFRQSYNLLWYSFAILTGAFYVSGVEHSRDIYSFYNENRVTQKASSFLRNQLTTLSQFCKNEHFRKEFEFLCEQSPYLLHTLLEYENCDPAVYHSVGPRTIQEVYGHWKQISDEKIHRFRTEARAYNDKECPVVEEGDGWKLYTSSEVCIITPSSFCRTSPSLSSKFVGDDAPERPLALVTECILSTLISSRERQEKLNQILDASSKHKHKRWLFYIAFSIIIGG